jgi:hypothetical protein
MNCEVKATNRTAASSLLRRKGAKVKTSTATIRARIASQ